MGLKTVPLPWGGFGPCPICFEKGFCTYCDGTGKDKVNPKYKCVKCGKTGLMTHKGRRYCVLCAPDGAKDDF
jgi:hypothetical protein